MRSFTIITLLLLTFQSSFGQISKWSLTLQNKSVKELPIQAVNDQGYLLGVNSQSQSKVIILPHKVVTQAQPLGSLPISLELISGDSNQAELLQIQDSTVYLAGQLPSSEWRTIEIKFSQIASLSHQGQVIILDSLGWNPSQPLRFTSTLPTHIAQAQSVPEVQEAPLNSLYIGSETPGAIIYINGLPTLAMSPFTYQGLPLGKYHIEMRWQVNQNLWATETQVQLFKSTQKKIYAKSERVRPELTIQSEPSHATIRIANTHDKDYENHWVTPLQLKDIEPGIRELTLQKEGYRDTTFLVNVMAAQPTLQVVELQPDLSLANSMHYQQLKQRKWGVSLMWAAIPTAALSGVYHALAENQLRKAWETKKTLRLHGIHQADSPQYTQAKQENRRSVQEANSHYQTSQILIGIATILGTAGVVLYF